MGLSEEEIRIIQAQIRCLDKKISYLVPKYREFRDLLEKMDQDVMALLNRKWALERKLVKVKILPPYTGETAPPFVPKKMPKLSDSEAEELYKLLTTK